MVEPKRRTVRGNSTPPLIDIPANIAELSPDLIVQFDAAGVCTYANAAFGRTVGIPPAECLGKTPERLGFSRKQAELLSAQMKHVGETGQEENFLVDIAHAGTVRKFELLLVPVQPAGKAGRAVNIYGRCNENVDLLEERVRLGEERLREIIEGVPFGAHLYQLSDDYRLIFVGANRAADRILKVENQKFVGKTIDEAFPALKATDIPEGYRRVAATGKPFGKEQVMYNEQGIAGAFKVNAFSIGNRQVVAFFEDITERKKAEEALRSSEDRYRSVVEASRDGISLTDLKANTLFANKQMALMLGYQDPREIIGRNAVEFFVPQDHHRALDSLKKTLASGVSGNVEYSLVARDGTVFPVELSAATVHDKQGNPSGFSGVIRDLRERRRLERSLRISEERFKGFFERSPVGLAIIDKDFRYVLVNDTLAKYNHLPAPAHLGKTLREIIPKAAPRSESVLHQVFTSRKPVLNIEMSERLRPDSDEIKCWIGSYFPISGEDGRVDLVGIVINDITERKLMENKLIENQRFIERVLGTTPNLIYINDLNENRNVYSNLAMSKVLGYSSRDVQNMGDRIFEVLMDPDDVPRVRRHIEDMKKVADEEVVEFEYRMRHHDGQWRWLLTRETPFIRDPDGSVKQVIGTATDITDRKRDQAQVKKSFEKLQQTTDEVIGAISRLVELKDPYTAGHQRRVSQLATAIAKEMNLPQAQTEGIRVAGLIHDIGKLYVPSEILSKPSRLTKVEFDIIKIHPTAGYEILKNIEFPWPVAKIVHQHQERLNGSGYPFGLMADAILLETKIVSVADVVEAMSFHRPYRAVIGLEKAFNELRKNRGVLYLPEAVDTCLKLFLEKQFEFCE